MSRQQGVHVYGRARRSNGIFLIPKSPNVVIQGSFAEAQTACSRKQRSRDVGASTRLAQSGTTSQARNTAATRRNEGQNHLITRLQIVNASTALLDFAGGLMT